MQVGSLIREVRESKGVTQVELCTKVGINQSKLSQIENGKYLPSLVTLQRLAWGLDCKICDLWKDEPPTVTLTDPRYLGRADRGLTKKPIAKKRNLEG